jgi:hypothetical protein
MLRPSRAAGLVATIGLLWLIAAPAALATVTGGCEVTGESPRGSIDLTTATEWHLRSTDLVGGRGSAPEPQKAVTVVAYSLGLPLPVVSAVSEDEEGETEGSTSGIAVSTYAALGHRFFVAGASTSCSGSVLIILDDVNPFLTLLGGGGLVAAVVGLLAMLWVARHEDGCLMTLLGAFFGLLTGLGLSLLLEQLGFFDPTVPLGLGLVVVLAVIGAILAGRLAAHPELEPPA